MIFVYWCWLVDEWNCRKHKANKSRVIESEFDVGREVHSTWGALRSPPLTGLWLQMSASIEQLAYLMASVNRDTDFQASIASTNQKPPIDYDARKWIGGP